VSNSAAKRIFSLMVETGDRPEQIAEREGLAQVGDEARLAAWVDDVIAERPAEWQRYLAGEKKLLGVFVGAVMKRSSGRADPRKVNQLLSVRASGYSCSMRFCMLVGVRIATCTCGCLSQPLSRPLR